MRQVAGTVLYVLAAVLLAVGAALMLKAAGLLADEQDDWQG